VALALVACQPVATVPKPARGGTAVEALVGQPTVLSPLFETNDSTRDVDSLIYQGLTSVDAQQSITSTYSEYGTPVSVSAPAASDTVEAPDAVYRIFNGG